MVDHDHREYVEGCFRCDLSREEIAPRIAPPLDQAARKRMREAKPEYVYRARPADLRNARIID